MPDIISPRVFRAQVVFQGTSNLPADRYVNTFHFQRDDASTAPMSVEEEAEIGDRLIAFYNDNHDTYGIHTFLSVLIHREANLAQVRIYDLGQEDPREPHVRTWTLGAADSGGRIPQEVALCMSFYGSRNIPRQRGRVYLGPFEIGAINTATGRPTDLLRNITAAAGHALMDSNDLVDWVTVHRAASSRVTHIVTNGWCDNEFDTQRRRQLESTLRTTFV